MTKGRRRRRSGPDNRESNRLIGWLVSYADNEQGSSIEIRSGRHLVSRHDSGDKHTIVLQDNSIASPHLALKASSRQGLMCMDIFSSSGSFLIRNDGDQETPISGPIPLEHGDWLRIGQNVRFQVCLIDGSSR